jgi:thiol-disulfide isomerase/thioredoxin
MNKNTRNLVITILVFAILLAVALVAYNALKDRSVAPVYTPEIKAEAVQEESAIADAPDPEPAQGQVSAPDDPEPAPKMPDIALTRLDGSETSFDQVRQGKPAIINLFASWCPPCKAELPYFLEAYEQYKDQIEFIFIDSLDGTRETMETISSFVEEFPFTAPVYFDQGVFASLFQTTALPTTVFFAADGTVSNGYLGMVNEEALQQSIEALLQ